MATWDLITTGYNAADETLNFGTRVFAESQNSIYETVTLSTIGANYKVNSNPDIETIGDDRHVCIKIDRVINIFDKDCSEVQMYTSFETDIDCLLLTDCSNYLISCLQDGSIKCFHIPSGQLVFSLIVPNNEIAFDRCFVSILKEKPDESQDISYFIVVCHSGSIYRLIVSDFGHVSQLLQSADDSNPSDEPLIGNVQLELFADLERRDDNISTATHSPENGVLLIAGKSFIKFDCNMKVEVVVPTPNVIKKIEIFERDLTPICLLDDGMLYMLCLSTLQFCPISNLPLSKDFFIIEGITPDESTNILLLTTPDLNGNSYIKLISFPDLEIQYDIHVSPFTHLVRTNQNREELVFIEGINSPEIDFVDTLRIKSVSESLPEFRFERLLKRYQFEEAEKFARKFHLDLQILYTAKARRILFLLQCLQEPRSKLITQLKEVFDNVHDLPFILESCKNAKYDDISQMRDLIEYSQYRLKGALEMEPNNVDLFKLESDLFEIILKLETYQLLPEFYESKCEPDIDEWIDFSQKDLFELIIRYLQNEDFAQASILWCRHHDAILKKYHSWCIPKLLAVIPSDSTPVDLFPWLKHFSDIVLQEYPQFITEIITHVIKKIRSLEVSNRTTWPECGIGFAEEVLLLFTITGDNTDAVLALNKQNTTWGSALQSLILTLKTLKELYILKTEYNVRISLLSYMEPKPETVVSNLISSVHPDRYAEIMPFLHEYMLDRKLVADTVFSNYIKSIVSNSPGWWNYTVADWETEVLSLLKHVTGVEPKLKMIVLTLCLAPVPWTPQLMELAEEGIAYQHSIAAEVKLQMMNAELKLILKKYIFKVDIQSLSKEQALQLARRIIAKQKPDFFIDLKQLIELYTNIETDTYVILIQYYIRHDNLKDMLNFLDELDLEMMIKCCKYILTTSEDILHMKQYDDTLRTNYLELLGDVAVRLKQAEGEYCYSVAHGDDLRKIHQLQVIFGISLSLSEYVMYEERLKIFEKFVKNRAETLETAVHNGSAELEQVCSKTFVDICRFTDLMKFSNVDALYRLSMNCGDKKITIFLAKYFLYGHFDNLNTDELKMMTLIAVKLLSPQKMNLDIVPVIPAPLDPNQLSVEAISLASKLIRKACMQNNVTNDIIELARWSYIIEQPLIESPILNRPDDTWHVSLNQPILRADPLYKWRFTPMYKDVPISSMTVLELIKEAFYIFQNVIKFCPHISNPINLSPDTNRTVRNQTDSKIESILQPLRSIIVQLQSNQQDLTAFRILCAFNRLFVSNKIGEWIQKLIKVLLQKMLCARKFDLDLSLITILVLNRNEAFKLINTFLKMYRDDLHRLSAVTALGLKYCKMQNVHQIQMQMMKLQKIDLRCTWAQKMIGLGRSPMDAFIQDVNVLLNIVLSSKNVPLPFIIDFCKDFKLDVQGVLLDYLKKLLLKWEPDFEIKSAYNKKSVVVKNERELYDRCVKIVDHIGNDDRVVFYLNAVWNEANFYNYEVYSCVLKLLRNTDSEKSVQHDFVLNLLKNYVRNQKPQQHEKENWNQKFQDSCNLPKISEWRLPFPPFYENNFWETVKCEVNLDSYDQWIQFAPILQLDKDHVYTYAIKQTVRNIDWSDTRTETEERWYLQPRKEYLLRRIIKCAQKLSNIEISTGIMFFVTNNIPPGADRLIAAIECFDLSKKWVKTCPANKPSENCSMNRCNEKVHHKYVVTVCTHVLYLNGLSELESLCEQPKQLINALYEHSNIIERDHSALLHCPDINKIAEEIAELHDLNIYEMRLQLIEKWLPADNNSQNNVALDDTFCIQMLPSGCDNNTNKVIIDDNLIRVCYILQAEEIDNAITYLINIALNLQNKITENTVILDQTLVDIENGCNRSYSMRFRAMQCIVRIANDSQIENLTGMKIAKFREYMEMLWCLTQLDESGISYNTETWDSCDKLNLVRTLWPTHAHQPATLRLMAALLKKIDSPQILLWRMIITQMINLSMISDLKRLLPQIFKLFPYLITTEEYIEAWKKVLETPFVNAPCPLNDDAEKECLDSLLLLQTCPIASKLRLESIINHCLRIKRPDMAAVLLPYLPNRYDHLLIKNILDTDRDLIFKRLNVLECAGIVTAKQAVSILMTTTQGPRLR